MNTDNLLYDKQIRDTQFYKNISPKKSHAFYNDSCEDNLEYAKEQNTIYDPVTNRMLYGLSSNLHVTGVSDGTCNQLDPLIFTPNYICGAGVAGGNRCVKDAYGIETFEGSSNNLSEFIGLILLLLILVVALYLKYNKDSL